MNDSQPEQSQLQLQVQNQLEVEQEVTALHLDYCIRILPHDQNTGGFFVAVFEKIDSFFDVNNNNNNNNNNKQ